VLVLNNQAKLWILEFRFWSLKLLSLWKLPPLSQLLVFGFGEEDVNGVFGGVDGGDELFELGLGHGGAACGGAAAAAAPNVKEDGAAESGDGLAA